VLVCPTNRKKGQEEENGFEISDNNKGEENQAADLIR